MGSLAYILPYIEQDNIFRMIPPNLLVIPGTGGVWWGSAYGTAQNKVKTFNCPTDNADSTSPSVGTFAYFTTANTTLTGGYFPGSSSPLGKTNYTTNAGALGNTTNTFWGKWRGPYYVDSKTTIVSITDGTSNTMAFGEILGGRETGSRDFNASWMGAGALPTAWSTISPAQWYSFGSKHTGVVQFGWGDGSVRSVITSAFGFYSIDGVAAGQSAVISVASKKFTFSQPSRVINLDEDLNDVDFVADE